MQAAEQAAEQAAATLASAEDRVAAALAKSTAGLASGDQERMRFLLRAVQEADTAARNLAATHMELTAELAAMRQEATRLKSVADVAAVQQKVADAQAQVATTREAENSTKVC